MNLDRDTVLAALRPEDVAAHYGITGVWRGRWMRSRRCAVDDHGTDAFGLSRQGFWHCHACDKGGDLLTLIAAGEKLDLRSDFGAVLAAAARIAGLGADDPWDPAPAPRPARPPAPELPPLHERLALAKRRAAWVWGRLMQHDELKVSLNDMYLHQRGLDPKRLAILEDLRETPLRCTMQEAMKSPDMKSLSYTFAVPGVALPVRHVDTGELVDVRVRRFEPRADQPKIVGMLGGLTAAPAEPGRQRQLIGCYGRPHEINGNIVVVVEGALDYLSALCMFPGSSVLGAVDAGSLGLVAAHAARAIADTGDRLVIVEQNDEPRAARDGTVRIGAADASVNEDPNAATKVAVRILGPRRVGWLFCGDADKGGSTTKDLNDLVRAGCTPDDLAGMVRWWAEIGDAA